MSLDNPGRRIEPFERQVRRPADTVATRKGGMYHTHGGSLQTTKLEKPSPRPIQAGTLECDMKKLLLSAAIVALASPAWAQTQADYRQQAIEEGISESLDFEKENSDSALVWTIKNFEETPDLIVTGHRIGYSDTDEITSPVTTITQTEIQNRNQGVVADLLRTVPGLAVSQNGGAGSLTQIRLRGSEANHILVIIDGVEVANPSDGAFDFDLSLIHI